MLSDVLREKTDKWIAKRRQERIEEAEARGESRGEAKNQKLWQDWNARRMECQARGELFDEPPPSLD